MSENKGNNPYSFDNYNIIGNDNTTKKDEKINIENEIVSDEPKPSEQQPQQVFTEQKNFQAVQQQQVVNNERQAIPQQPPPAYNPGVNQGFVNQFGSAPQQKTGQTGVFFWILFSLLAIFDLLLFGGGSGTTFFVLSLIILLFLFVIRKSISKGIVKPVLCFLGAIIVTFMVFAFTGTGEGNKSSISVGGNGDKKAFDFSFSIGNKDKPDVAKEGFSSSVEQNTLKPVEKTTVFNPNADFIYYSVFAKYLPENTEIVAKWYFEGTLQIETVPEKMQTALKDQYYTTHLQKGEKPFPIGKYKIELVMSKDGSEIYKCSDEFSVGDGSGVKTSPTQNGNVLFEDSFKRQDSSLVGDEWQEVAMRNGTGDSVPVRASGDTPWSIINNTLSYEGVGNNTYTEDFIETVQEFPIDNVKVEFELRGKASTLLGYVGPGAFWAPSQEKRLGGFSTVEGKDPLIGVQAFYGWENKGTKGLVFRMGEGIKSTDGILAGVNQNEFVKHVIILKDGKMTYQAGNSPSVTFDLVNKPESGAKRHFSFDVRYYDNGVPFKTEIRNFKISLLE